MKKIKILSFIMAVLFLSALGQVFANAIPTKPATLPGAVQEAETFKKSPILPRSGIWLNTPKQVHAHDFKDKVTLVYFWDYATINAIRELDYLKKWHKRYHAYGLDMIFVHSPEFEFAYDEKNVMQAVSRFEIAHPVFLDNDFKLWEDYGTKTWPTKYLINASGEIVNTHVGEGKYSEFEFALRGMILEINPSAILPDILMDKEVERDAFNTWKCGEMTSETYIGYKRADWWGIEVVNGSEESRDLVVEYRDKGSRLERGFFAHGLWTHTEESFVHERESEDLDDYIGMLYLGNEAYVVMGTGSEIKESRVYVTRDGKPVPYSKRGHDLREDSEGGTYVLVQEPRLYYLIEGEDYDYHELKLMPRNKGLEVFSFSFSNRCLSDFQKV